MLRAWFNMWRDMFKFFPPHRIRRREFAFAMLINFIGFLGIYIAFFEFDIYPENSVEFMGSIGCVWGIAILSLLMRRLRDAGFSPLLALLLYGWGIWRLSDWEKDIFEILSGFFSLVFLVAFVLFLCCFPTKDIEQKGEARVGMLQAWRNLWKNTFKFQAPYRTDRREFALAITTSLASFAVIFTCAIWFYEALLAIILVIWFVFGIAFCSLVARRLRDAGFSAWLVLPFPLLVVLPLLFEPIFYIFYMFRSSDFYSFFDSLGYFYFFYFIALIILCCFPTKK